MVKRDYLRIGAVVLLALILFLALTVNLESTPPLWWDEGWTLAIARNWVEDGYYGHLMAGQPTTEGLGHAFPVNAMVALSFRLFGIGIWQGRLINVIFTVGTLALVYHLAKQVYDRTIGIATLAVLLFMSANLYLHPALLGRQVLAEPMMLLCLLLGYVFILEAWRRPMLFMPLAVISWGIGLETKAQPLPFWIASLTIPLLLAMYQRRWKSVALLSSGLLGSLIVSQVLIGWLQEFVLHGQAMDRAPTPGLYDVTAFVLVPHVRLVALFAGVTIGLPTLLGLCYCAWRLIENRNSLNLDSSRDVVRLMLLMLAGSWFAWYLLLSAAWGRYLYPATFVGSIFVAVLLRDLTNDFDWKSTITRSARIFRHLNRQNAGALVAMLLIAWTVPSTLKTYYQSYIVEADASLLQATDFLNNETAPGALIESYDSELFFLLERPYHYPPDQIHIELNRRTFLGQDVPIDYDPLMADPDYLVIGPISRMWRLYEDVLRQDHFALLKTIGRYTIYQRQ